MKNESQPSKIPIVVVLAAIIFGILTLFLRADKKYHYIYNLVTEIPVGCFFVYAHYLFFFHKRRKVPEVKKVLWKLMLLVYSLVIVILLLNGCLKC